MTTLNRFCFWNIGNFIDILGHLERQSPTGSVSKKPCCYHQPRCCNKYHKDPQIAGHSGPRKPQYPATQLEFIKDLELGMGSGLVLSGKQWKPAVSMFSFNYRRQPIVARGPRRWWIPRRWPGQEKWQAFHHRDTQSPLWQQRSHPSCHWLSFPSSVPSSHLSAHGIWCFS